MNSDLRLDDKIYVAGHRGMVGSALLRCLSAKGYQNLVTRTHAELDLTRQAAVEQFFAQERPDHVLVAAARVGGILANNTYRAEFIYSNLMIATNIIHAAYTQHVNKLLFLGSSCIYPKLAPQPIKEDALLTGALESTNEPYAVAKIAAIKMCASYNQQYGTNFLSVMPTNLYGPGDNYDTQNSHVLPALIRKIHQAKVDGAAAVTVWGSGTPRREFLYSEDLADACVFLMENFSATDVGEVVNIGTGEDITIAALARTVARIIGFDGSFVFDTGKPDGTPRKVLDVSKLAQLGWRASTVLEDGIRRTYHDYLARFDPTYSSVDLLSTTWRDASAEAR